MQFEECAKNTLQGRQLTLLEQAYEQLMSRRVCRKIIEDLESIKQFKIRNSLGGSKSDRQNCRQSDGRTYGWRDREKQTMFVAWVG